MKNRTRRTVVSAVIGLAGLLTGVVLAVGASWLVSRDEVASSPTLLPLAKSPTVSTATSRPTATRRNVQVASATPPPTPIPTTALATAPTSAPPLNTTSFITHTVTEGQTLIGIALGYNATVEDVMAANEELSDPDLIYINQVLRIPIIPADVGVLATEQTPPTAPAVVPTITVAATASQEVTEVGEGTSLPGLPSWPPSIISGDLSTNYPLLLTTTSGRLRIHYQPGTHPEANIEDLSGIIDEIFAQLQADMGGQVTQPVDVYLGGTLFGVNPSLQGFTQSYEFRTFVLVNGAFHRGERNYILGHELSHVAATHILGPASSTMIHEGLATYLPQRYLVQEAGYLPIEEICAAAWRTASFRSAVQLSQLSYGADGFGGHIRTFFNYNLSGCFVGYLLETYGMAQLDRVYESGDYAGVYGLTLQQLDEAWQATLAEMPMRQDPQAFVTMVNDVARAYESYIGASTGGIHANYEAYLHLNGARLAVNRGELSKARRELDIFWSLMGR